MRVAVRRIDGYAHEVDLEGGHAFVVDEPAAAGGTDTGPRPTQLLGASLASCVAITMEMYARRKEWEIGQVEVTVEVGYDGPVPRTFDVSVDLPAQLDEERRRRLLRIASRCPVHQVLAGAATVTIADRPGAS